MLSQISKMVFDFRSIFHPLYLTSAFLIAVFCLKLRSSTWKSVGSELFSRKVWLRKSTLIDILFCVAYFAILRGFITRIEKAAFTNALNFTNSTLSFAELGITTSIAIEGALATAVTMLSIDFASYAVHRMMHGHSLLWRIHRVHHSARHLTPFTTYRQHPLEPLILYGARGLSAGVALALFYCIFPRQTPVITVAGLGAGFFIYMFTVNLHHWPISVKYPSWLCKVLVSPHVHHLHHRQELHHQKSNFGVVFSFWDRVFKTYLDAAAHQPPPPPELWPEVSLEPSFDP